MEISVVDMVFLVSVYTNASEQAALLSKYLLCSWPMIMIALPLQHM